MKDLKRYIALNMLSILSFLDSYEVLSEIVMEKGKEGKERGGKSGRRGERKDRVG